MLALTGQILCGLSLGMLSSFVLGASSVGLWTLAWPWILGVGLIGVLLLVLAPESSPPAQANRVEGPPPTYSESINYQNIADSKRDNSNKNNTKTLESESEPESDPELESDPGSNNNASHSRRVPVSNSSSSSSSSSNGSNISASPAPTCPLNIVFNTSRPSPAPVIVPSPAVHFSAPYISAPYNPTRVIRKERRHIAPAGSRVVSVSSVPHAATSVVTPVVTTGRPSGGVVGVKHLGTTSVRVSGAPAAFGIRRR